MDIRKNQLFGVVNGEIEIRAAMKPHPCWELGWGGEATHTVISAFVNSHFEGSICT